MPSFFNSNLDVAGNTVSLLGKEAPSGNKEVFGLEYAQYAKIDGDWHYHFRLPNNHVIATRLFAGIGIPYGNSEVLPFSKQYFSGGPYSVRAFRIRSLGPGTYYPQQADANDPASSTVGYFDQSGNIRLEANAEYRFPLITYLNGAFSSMPGTSGIHQRLQRLPELQKPIRQEALSVLIL